MFYLLTYLLTYMASWFNSQRH